MPPQTPETRASKPVPTHSPIDNFKAELAVRALATLKEIKADEEHAFRKVCIDYLTDYFTNRRDT